MKTSILLPFLGLSSTLFLMSGCQPEKEPVVAHVGSMAVPLTEVQRRLRETPPAYQHYVGTTEGRKQYLQLLLREKTVLAKARQDGIQRDASYEKEIEKFKERQANQLAEYKDTLLVESYLRKLRSKELAVTDAEVQHYYESHPEFYNHPQEIVASHILVNTREDAERVLARLKQGESFETLAHDLSRDPASAAQGGRLAPFRHGSLVPEFEDAVFALKKGEISGIVQTQFGFHIIKKINQTNLPPRSYAEAKEEIRRQLERAKFDQWVVKQEAQLGVKVDESVAAQLSVPSPTAIDNNAGDPAQETPRS